MTGHTPDAWRSLFAEVRAVESGQHARWSDERRCFVVASESEPGVNRAVTVAGLKLGPRVYLTFGCDCPQGIKGRQAPYGMTFCRHSALVARRLQREGLARWAADNQRWFAVGRLEQATLEALDAVPERGDPPVTVEDRRTQRRRPPLPDTDTLADQLRAGM